jgi:hypothetical protein
MDNVVKLGVQIRWGRGPSDFYLSNQQDVEKFFYCAYNMARNHMMDGKQVVIFLATDTPTIRNQTEQWFAKLGIPVYFLTERVRYDGEKHTAVVDQMLLAETDDMLVTQLSTFGYHVHATRALVPQTVTRVHKTCWRRIDSQSGMVTKGGSWPFGDSICWSIPLTCCTNETLIDLFSYFLPVG